MKRVSLLFWLMVLITACYPQNSAENATSLITSTPILKIKPTETATSKIIPSLTPTPKPPDQLIDSPNGEFIAEFDNAYIHPAYFPQVIKILNKDGITLWEIPYQYTVEKANPHPSLKIYGWSKDSNYLYFYYEFNPDGGNTAFWWDGFDIQGINVHTGVIEQLIPSDGFIAFAFSHDETQIAYTRSQDNPSVLFIKNLSTGKEKGVSVLNTSQNYSIVGDIHWSPLGNEIAFQTETEDLVVQTIYIDLLTMKQKVVKEYRTFELWFQGWSNNGMLEFLDVTKGQVVININPKNSEIIIIGTPTPP